MAKGLDTPARKRAERGPVRDRTRPFKVWVTPAERDQIEAKAAEAGLSVSAYLRAAGLSQHLKRVYDLEAVDQLAKVGGDLGRLGGLLKLWLFDRRGQGAAVDVDRLLKETRALQQEMLELMRRA